MIDNLKYIKGSSAIGSPIAIFDAEARDWSIVYFQPEQPVLEGELNLLQQSQNRRFRDLVRGIYPKGGVLKELDPTATGVTNQFRLHTLNTPFYAILDGLVKPVYAYDSGGTPTVGGNRVTMPAYTSGTYDQTVYLEVWFEEIMSPEGGAGTNSVGGAASAGTTVYQYGMTGTFTFSNDVKVNAVPLAETTRRVQLRGELKNVLGTSLTGVLAKGAAGYGYGQVAGTNYFRAGNGTNTAGDALNSVDGYSYAIPLVRINRKAGLIAQGDIFLATDIIPTGSDVADQIIALQNRATSLEDGRALKSILLTAGAGLTGGGDLSANRTFSIGASQITAAMLDTTYWSTVTRRSDADDDLRFAQRANNLSDLTNAGTARTNLGLGAAATMGTTALRNSNVTTTVLQAKSMYDHTLATAADHDGRYYTEAEVDALIAGVAVGAHTHDDRYYTESEIDGMLAGLDVAGHTHTTAEIVSGTFGVARGGTGIASYTAGSFIRALNATTLEQRTASQVRGDIGAAASVHTHAIADVTSLQATLDGKAGSSHAHSAADVTSGTLAVARGGTGLGSYTAGSFFYASTTGIMAQRTPAQVLTDIGAAATSHAHSAADVTSGTLAAARGGTGIASYTTGNYVRASGLTSIEQRTPAQVLADIGAAATAHTHAIANVTGLQTALDGKAASSHTHSAADVTSGTLAVARGGTGIASYTVGNFIYASGATTLAQRTPSQVRTDIGAASSSHSHAISDVTNLQSTLDGKAASSHTHSISNVTSLQTELDGKVTLTTTQTITGAKTARTTSGFRVENASTQDAILVKGRAAGTSSRSVTLIPGTLTASRTLTAPDLTGTIVVNAGTQSIGGTKTFTTSLVIDNAATLLLPVK